MADRELLTRIDEHMARANEHMARGNEHMARGNEHMARGNELMARIIELTDDNRRFTHDLLRRNERVMAGFAATIDRVSQELREMRRETIASRQMLIDVHEDSVAQRQGFLALIDELREHGLGGRG